VTAPRLDRTTRAHAAAGRSSKSAVGSEGLCPVSYRRTKRGRACEPGSRMPGEGYVYGRRGLGTWQFAVQNS
jgi:hypothetical protein